MTTDDLAPTPPIEADPRFPSGEWTGFFLQPDRPGRQRMELLLTFSDGRLAGEGRDVVGRFTMIGRYDVSDGRCHWSKSYVGKHSVAYRGYNEGKGIWGTWQIPPISKGGFRIWPIAMSDPTLERLAETLEAPADEPETTAVVEEEVAAPAARAE